MRGFKQIMFICLLTAVIVSGCASPTPPPTPTAAKPQTNNLADIINPPQTPSTCVEISVSYAAP